MGQDGEKPWIGERFQLPLQKGGKPGKPRKVEEAFSGEEEALFQAVQEMGKTPREKTEANFTALPEIQESPPGKEEKAEKQVEKAQGSLPGGEEKSSSLHEKVQDFPP